MKNSLSLLLVAAAAACGLALAQNPAPSAQAKLDTAQELAALRKRVEVLEASVADLTKAKGEAAELATKDRTGVAAIVKYLQSQSAAAAKLQTVLNDSKDKGFTYGINPDSRTVLLQGFHDFAQALETDVPSNAAPAPAKEPIKN